MARKSGISGSLSVGGVNRLGVTNIKWNATRDLPDATGMDSAGAKQAVDGLIGANFSCDAHVDDGGAGGFPATVQTGGAVAFQLDLDVGPVRRYSGNCRISATPSATDVNGTVTYNIEALVEGAWVET